ncbi:MAG: ABC transporter ATP-binding protein/permease [Clostridia bacterium]|nr:ABC transporter ATP-binding protein/permease [Clostridia bacterium]
MRTVMKYLYPYRWLSIAAIIVKFLGTVAELVLPLLLEYVIDTGVSLGLSHIIVPGVVMLLFAALALVGNVWANRLSVNASGKLTHDLRKDLFTKISYLKCGQVDVVSTPSLISRLTSDTYYVNEMVARVMRMGIRSPILVIGGLILSFVLDPLLACVLLVCVPVVGIGLWIITRRSVPMYAAVQKSGDRMVRSAQENASGIRVIKALSKTEYESGKFEGVAEDLSGKEYKANKIMAMPNPLSAVVLNLGIVAIIVIGAVCGKDGGVILALLSYFTIIQSAMMGISRIFVSLSKGIASASRIEQVMDIDSTETTMECPEGDEGYAVQFKDVSFSYNGNGNNVEGINFALKKGETLGIIGATGSGKSTIINLMMRFYDASSGAVYIDGEDVRSVPEAALRAKFGAAFQNDFLMSYSLRDNVAYGRDIPDERIKEALRDAQAEEFVKTLDGGLDFMLTQKGTNLSGGQKQRILIARALAGNPEILVLDDSSSALDYATDAALRKALAEHYADSTKIIVAQRISSVKSADMILVMDDGRPIGLGRHEELMSSCEEYRMIYAAQMGGE